MRICQNPNYTSFPNWMLLGGSSEQNSTMWYPFSNTIRFSKPIQELQFLLLIGGTIYPDIDFGAENFVFEASNCSITLESIYSCNSLIIEDTIYLGVGNTGTGWFSVSFDKPIFEFAISGKGGGNGSAFQICSNSIILAPLWASMSAPPNLCNNGHVQFTAYGTSPPYTFTYSIDGGSPQSIQTTGSNSSESIEVGLGTTFPQTGPYEIELLSITDSDGNTEFLTCNNTAIINVHNEEPPLAQFTATPTTGFVPLQVTTQNQSSNATEYDWLIGGFGSAQPPAVQPPTSVVENPFFTFQDTGAYEITLIASNALGCIDTAKQTIHVLEQLQVVIPNVFTPNNDGINDWFGITSNVEANASIVILNRWGNVIFEKEFETTPNVFEPLWDGTSTGSVTSPSSVTTSGSGTTLGSGDSADGVYFYRVRVGADDPKAIEFSGFVHLKR